MKLFELWELMKKQEFLNLAIGEEDDANCALNLTRWVNAYNSAMIQTYSNLPLNLRVATFTTTDQNTSKFILPDATYLSVVTVFNLTDGYGLPVNDNSSSLSAKIKPLSKELYVPNLGASKLIEVTYKCGVGALTVADMNEEVQVPDHIVPSTRAHIAFTIFGSINSEGSMGISASYFKKFTGLIDQVLMENNADLSVIENNRFTANGFV